MPLSDLWSKIRELASRLVVMTSLLLLFRTVHCFPHVRTPNPCSLVYQDPSLSGLLSHFSSLLLVFVASLSSVSTPALGSLVFQDPSLGPLSCSLNTLAFFSLQLVIVELIFSGPSSIPAFGSLLLFLDIQAENNSDTILVAWEWGSNQCARKGVEYELNRLELTSSIAYSRAPVSKFQTNNGNIDWQGMLWGCGLHRKMSSRWEERTCLAAYGNWQFNTGHRFYIGIYLGWVHCGYPPM